jgi:hypothetical protein
MSEESPSYVYGWLFGIIRGTEMRPEIRKAALDRLDALAKAAGVVPFPERKP